MRLDKKGMTMVEIIVSVALISIVLIFLMNLFVKVRSTYAQSKAQSDYEILVSNVIKAIGDDIDKYGLRSVKYKDEGSKSSIILEFNSFRPTQLSERIKKVLRLYFVNNHYYINYSYDATLSANLTSDERVTSVIREIPDDVVIDSKNYIELKSKNDMIEIKVPMSNSKGTVYDINVYGVFANTSIP